MNDYFSWLLERVEAFDGQEFSRHQTMLRELFSIDYIWQFELDRNRAVAGTLLRNKFADEMGVYPEEINLTNCTVLEMLEALAEVISDQMGDTVSRWFWEMIHNLSLDTATSVHDVDTIVDKWLSREYAPNGQGSIFPLKNYDGDVRNLKIWDQMNIYINENYPLEEGWLN